MPPWSNIFLRWGLGPSDHVSCCQEDAQDKHALWLCRLRNREQYQDFLKALNLYASEIVSKSELQQMVHDILARYPDLMVRHLTTPALHPEACLTEAKSSVLLSHVIANRSLDCLLPLWPIHACCYQLSRR